METTQKPITPAIAKQIESSKSIKVNLTNSKAKVEFKSKGHKEGRMKVTLKFNKDEAEGFVNFCKLAKPDNMPEDSFVKFLFYRGVQALQQDFASKIEQYQKENPEEYAKVRSELEKELAPTGSVTVADDSEKQ